MLSLSVLFAFSACKKEETETTTAVSEISSTSQKAQEQTSQNVSQTEESETTPSTTEKKTEKKTQKTTTQMPSTKANEAIPITVNEALDRLSDFYGSAYDVNASVKEGDYQYFKVTDKKGNKYAQVKVNLKTSDAEETIEHTKEVNYFNLLV